MPHTNTARRGALSIPHPLPPTLLLQVARCTKIINPNTDDAKYVINVKQIAKVRI